MLLPLPAFSQLYLELNLRGKVAEFGGISERTFKNWEAGKNRPRKKQRDDFFERLYSKASDSYPEAESLIHEMGIARPLGEWAAFSKGFAIQGFPFSIERTLNHIKSKEKLTFQVSNSLRDGNFNKAVCAIEAANLNEKLIAGINFSRLSEIRSLRHFYNQLLVLYLRVPLYLISSIEAEATAMQGRSSGLVNFLPSYANGRIKLPVAKWFEALREASDATTWEKFENKAGLNHQQLCRWRNGDLRHHKKTLIPKWKKVEDIYKKALPDSDLASGLRIFAAIRIFQRTYDLLVSGIQQRVLKGTEMDIIAFFNDYAFWFRCHSESIE